MTGPHNASAQLFSNAREFDRMALVTLLRSMSLRERLVVCLRYADGLSLEEIAAVLNAGRTEVERLLEQAVERVRAAITPVIA